MSHKSDGRSNLISLSPINVYAFFFQFLPSFSLDIPTSTMQFKTVALLAVAAAAVQAAPDGCESARLQFPIDSLADRLYVVLQSRH